MANDIYKFFILNLVYLCKNINLIFLFKNIKALSDTYVDVLKINLLNINVIYLIF